MSNVRTVIGDYEPFLGEVFAGIKKAGIDMTQVSQIDHMCYRTTSLDNYEDMKSKLEPIAELLTETMVNERPISTYLLHEPVRYSHWRIDAIELPAPKVGSDYEEGLEHIECVLYRPNLKEFMEKYPDLEFNTKAIDRRINPEIGLSLGRHSVKFHILGLPAVTQIEKELGITKVTDGK